LERNLHDGAQQHLVAIKVKLGLVEMLATRDPEKAKATIVALKHDADEALETLRDLARGIYPPLLAEKGLAAALQSQARKATIPVRVDADGVGRYSQETEAALYFCALEALQNVQKYAQASSAAVRLREAGAQLAVEVSDNGRGFDVTAVTRGAGLTNIEDRLDALGGTLQIESTLGVGTTLRAALPVCPPVPIMVVSRQRQAALCSAARANASHRTLTGGPRGDTHTTTVAAICRQHDGTVNASNSSWRTWLALASMVEDAIVQGWPSTSVRTAPASVTSRLPAAL
jgi:hypothetical protein